MNNIDFWGLFLSFFFIGFGLVFLHYARVLNFKIACISISLVGLGKLLHTLNVLPEIWWRYVCLVLTAIMFFSLCIVCFTKE
jgi:hypothetical protein